MDFELVCGIDEEISPVDVEYVAADDDRGVHDGPGPIELAGFPKAADGCLLHFRCWIVFK